ncbi:MAG TPA: NAD(P)-dependent oxidoreductase [Pseudonocardiaceae bacterium]|jgi:3-hydroxyisobutyrate dehydrogenase|nr:NAD(P)-dependent oxidoreductase [Pseudonocardiaceae bacterium]
MTNVAVLGTGIMGAGMARSMARAGIQVTAWNRSEERARPLRDDGVTVAADPRSAVADADVVVTMLFDVAAVTDVMSRALPSMRDGAVWTQTSTVGLEGTDRLAALAEKHGVPFVDAPVLGTRKPAEDGKLVVLAGGPTSVRDAVAPVFEAIGSRTIWVGERPGDGHRLKLVANAWVLTVTVGTAQSVALATDLGVNPRLFLDVIADGPLDSAYAQLKGRAMLDREFAPAFTVSGAVKDARLIQAAMAEAGTDDAVMAAAHALFTKVDQDGRGGEDMAAVLIAMVGAD